jgi:hypothetical protein
VTAAAAVLARIEGAGAAAALDADGRVRIARASRVPPGVMEAARRHRDGLARLLAERRRAAFLLRAAEDTAEALAVPDPDLAREREEVATGLRAEAPDPARAGRAEVLPNGTYLHYCGVCGRLAAWGFGVALDRGRDGTWYCFKHRGRAG